MRFSLLPIHRHRLDNLGWPASDIARENRELKRKNRELEETIEILKAATSFFVRESDPRHR